MADNFTTNAGTGGDTFRADDVSGVKIPYSKIDLGGDGVSQPVIGSMPVTASSTDALLASVETLLSTLADTIGNHNSPFIDGTAGQVILGKRRDSDTTTVADGDLNTFNMDEEGRLKVASKPASYPDITGDITAVQATIGTPVAGGTVAGDVSRSSNIMAFCTGTFSTINCTFEGSLEASGDTNWFAVQAVRSNANTIETATGNLSAQPAYGWELSVNALRRVRVRCTARTSGTQSWRFVQGTYATEPIPAAQVSATQPVSGTVTSNEGTPVTPTASILNSAASTNGTVVKGSAGTIYALAVSNNGAGVAYFKLHNSTTVTVGTTAVSQWFKVPAGDSINIYYGKVGLRHGTGICYSITGAVADNDTTAVAAGQVKVNLSYI